MVTCLSMLKIFPNLFFAKFERIEAAKISYSKAYTIDTVYALLYDGGIKGDDAYVDGTGYHCKKRMECVLR